MQLKKTVQELRKAQLDIIIKLEVCLLHTCIAAVLVDLRFRSHDHSAAATVFPLHWLFRFVLQDLEDRVSSLEGGEGGEARKPREPEPILTCVQCNADYKESENAGKCHAHCGCSWTLGSST